MKDLQDVISDIRRMLKSGLYENEQHIRISLVAYICYSLNWNIWNPSEFYTEFSVVKTQVVTDGNDGKGKVDIALVKYPKKKKEALYALIETKDIGQITQQSRSQLQSYSLALNHPLSVLTDGIQWEFYLNSLPSPSGQYQDRMINNINLQTDDIGDLVTLFSTLLHNSVTPASATMLGKRMRKEFFIINCINNVKLQAISNHPNDIPKQLHAAFKDINTIYGKGNVSFEEVSLYWDTKMALGGLKSKPKGNGLGFSDGVLVKPLKDFTGMSLKEISISGSKAVRVSSLGQMKKLVYDHIITTKPDFDFDQQGPRIQKTEVGFTSPIQLKDGRFTEGSLSFKAAVDHCKRALKAAGFSDTDLIIGYIKP